MISQPWPSRSDARFLEIRKRKDCTLSEGHDSVNASSRRLRGIHQLPIAALVGFDMRVGRIVLMVGVVMVPR